MRFQEIRWNLLSTKNINFESVLLVRKKKESWKTYWIWIYFTCYETNQRNVHFCTVTETVLVLDSSLGSHSLSYSQSESSILTMLNPHTSPRQTSIRGPLPPQCEGATTALTPVQRTSQHLSLSSWWDGLWTLVTRITRIRSQFEKTQITSRTLYSWRPQLYTRDVWTTPQ